MVFCLILIKLSCTINVVIKLNKIINCYWVYLFNILIVNYLQGILSWFVDVFCG